MNNDLIKVIQKVDSLVERYYTFLDDDDDASSDYPYAVQDSFGKLRITSQSEPEDAIWSRDLQDNFHTGLNLGIRNTLKVLADYPELMEEFRAAYIGEGNSE